MSKTWKAIALALACIGCGVGGTGYDCRERKDWEAAIRSKKLDSARVCALKASETLTMTSFPDCNYTSFEVTNKSCSKFQAAETCVAAEPRGEAPTVSNVTFTPYDAGVPGKVLPKKAAARITFSDDETYGVRFAMAIDPGDPKAFATECWSACGSASGFVSCEFTTAPTDQPFRRIDVTGHDLRGNASATFTLNR